MRPRRGDTLLMIVSRPGPVVRARDALELAWSGIQVALPVPTSRGKLTHITVSGMANTNHAEPIPQIFEDFQRLFPRLHQPGIRWSEHPDGHIDLASDFVPWSWTYYVHAGPSMSVFHRCTIGASNDVARGSSRASVAVRLGADSSADECRHAFKHLLTAFGANNGYASPVFSINSRAGRPKWDDSPDEAGSGIGWLTYFRATGYDARAHEWGSTAVEAFADGWLLQAPSENPVADPDLFDKIVLVRDQVRRNGDVIRRQQAVSAGLDPDSLPPHPIGPQYLLEDGDSPCAAPPTAGF